jgi:hypothetical protein
MLQICFRKSCEAGTVDVIVAECRMAREVWSGDLVDSGLDLTVVVGESRMVRKLLDGDLVAVGLDLTVVIAICKATCKASTDRLAGLALVSVCYTARKVSGGGLAQHLTVDIAICHATCKASRTSMVGLTLTFMCDAACEVAGNGLVAVCDATREVAGNRLVIICDAACQIANNGLSATGARPTAVTMVARNSCVGVGVATTAAMTTSRRAFCSRRHLGLM